MIPTRTGAGISLWFACKICRHSFQNIEFFMEHKREKHFGEFQKLNCIVFEERAIANDNSDYNLERGSLPPAALIKQEVISSSDQHQHLDVKPAIYDILSTKAETGHTTAVTITATALPVTSETKQTFPKSPFAHLKRLRSQESFFKSDIKVNTPAYSQNSTKSIHQCRFCKKIKTCKNQLISHERIHTGVMPFRCIHCSRKFTWKQSCMTHQGRCKSNGDVGFKMPKRGRPRLLKTIFRQTKQENPDSASQKRVRTGTSNTHSAVTKLAKTRLVGPDIPKPNIGSVPVVTKNGTTPYLKNIPRKLFATKSKPYGKRTSYTCSYCYKEFSQKCNFLNHERLHTGEAPFSCDRCGSRFKAASGLSYHLIKSKSSPCSTAQQCTKVSKSVKSKRNFEMLF